MSDRPPSRRTTDRTDEPSTTLPLDSFEAYETESGAVIFDAERPTAWIESSAAVRIDEVA